MSAMFEPTRMRISVDRYQKMVETGVLTKYDRVELIEGAIFDMAPIGTRHAAVTARLNELFILKLAGRAIVSPGGPVNLGKYSEPQPDLMLLRPRQDFYESKHPEAADVLLLVEISESSLTFDQTTKLNLYARYGVPEYWILDVIGKRIIVCREPTQEGFAQRREVSAPESVAPIAFPDLVIAVSELLP